MELEEEEKRMEGEGRKRNKGKERGKVGRYLGREENIWERRERRGVVKEVESNRRFPLINTQPFKSCTLRVTILDYVTIDGSERNMMNIVYLNLDYPDSCPYMQ